MQEKMWPLLLHDQQTLDTLYFLAASPPTPLSPILLPPTTNSCFALKQYFNVIPFFSFFS